MNAHPKWRTNSDGGGCGWADDRLPAAEVPADGRTGGRADRRAGFITPYLRRNLASGTKIRRLKKSFERADDEC